MFPLSINLLLALPASLAQGGGGWDTLHELHESKYDLFGDQIAASPDLTGDGIDDIIVGTYQGDYGNVGGAGAVLIYSGTSGERVGLIDGPYRGCGLGKAVAALGDVDGDGLADVAVGSWARRDGGLVQVYRSSDWTELWTISGNNFAYSLTEFGHFLHSVGDVDGDGAHELLLTEPNASQPNAYLLSGADGSLLRIHSGVGSNSRFGISSASSADLNGDNVNDYLIGAPDESNLSNPKGTIHVYSGHDGSLMMSIPTPTQMIGIGESIEIIDDFNGDGVADILSGAPETKDGSNSKTGAAAIFSGVDGSLLFTLVGTRSHSGFGTSVAEVGDMDLDGVTDFAVGAPNWSYASSAFGGTVLSYSGATGRRIDRIKTGEDDARFGRTIEVLGDLNGDGLDELLLSSSKLQRVYVGSPSQFLSANRNEISSAQGGSIRFDLDFPDRTKGFEYRLVLSTSGPGWHEHQIWIPLVYDTAYELSWNNQYWPAKTYHAHGVLDRFGNATAGFEVLPGDLSFLVGQQLRFAAVCMRPGKDPKFTSAELVVDVLP